MRDLVDGGNVILIDGGLGAQDSMVFFSEGADYGLEHKHDHEEGELVKVNWVFIANFDLIDGIIGNKAGVELGHL